MVVYFFGILVLEIIFIILATKKKDKKYFKISNALFFSYFVSLFMYIIYCDKVISLYDIDEYVWLLYVFIAIILGILNLITGVVSLIIQKKKKYQFSNTTNKKTSFKYFLIITFLSLILILSQYMVNYNKKIKRENEIKQETMNYLENKYGSKDFKIYHIYYRYGVSGIISNSILESYIVYAIYIPENIILTIDIDVDSSFNLLKDSFKDSLLYSLSEKYFENNDIINGINQKIKNLNIYLEEQGFKANVENYNPYYNYALCYDKEIIPSNYGKIPSKNKLYELILDYYIRHNLKIDIKDYEIKSGVDLRYDIVTYLNNLSNYLIDYYDGLDEYEIHFNFYDLNGIFSSGTLKITKEFIIIDGVLEENDLKENIKR